MKKFYYAMTAVALLASTSSCKKSSGPNGSGGQNGSGLVRMQQGVDPTDDSIYLFRYDATNRLSVVIDSINQDTLTATYNLASQLTNIQESSPYGQDNLAATYNSTGQLAQIDYTLFGEYDRYIFTYSGSGNIPSQCAYYTNAGSGGLALYRTYIYTVEGQNITGVKEYNKSNVFLGEHKMTFGSQANPFKTLSLFNWGNRLGTDDIVTTETFFNANLLASTTWYGDSNNIFYTTTVTSTNNSAGNPVKIVAAEKYTDGSIQNLYTWGFSYK
jgi:hypothetical protein